MPVRATGRARRNAGQTPNERNSVKTTNPNLATLRVAKTYVPDQNGAKRFAKRYGEQLVCVRHRLSDDGSVRHATVELLIESTPITSRARALVAIKIGASDKNTRTLLMACGAQWVPKENTGCCRAWSPRTFACSKTSYQIAGKPTLAPMATSCGKPPLVAAYGIVTVMSKTR